MGRILIVTKFRCSPLRIPYSPGDTYVAVQYRKGSDTYSMSCLEDLMLHCRALQRSMDEKHVSGSQRRIDNIGVPKATFQVELANLHQCNAKIMGGN